MNHPLAGNLSGLSDQELSDKISELNRKASFAYRTANTMLVGQINLMLEDYMMEQKRRTDEKIRDLMKNEDGSDKWDDIIDIS